MTVGTFKQVTVSNISWTVAEQVLIWRVLLQMAALSLSKATYRGE